MVHSNKIKNYIPKELSQTAHQLFGGSQHTAKRNTRNTPIESMNNSTTNCGCLAPSDSKTRRWRTSVHKHITARTSISYLSDGLGICMLDTYTNSCRLLQCLCYGLDMHDAPTKARTYKITNGFTLAHTHTQTVRIHYTTYKQCMSNADKMRICARCVCVQIC